MKMDIDKNFVKRIMFNKETAFIKELEKPQLVNSDSQTLRLLYDTLSSKQLEMLLDFTKAFKLHLQITESHFFGGLRVEIIAPPHEYPLEYRWEHEDDRFISMLNDEEFEDKQDELETEQRQYELKQQEK